LHKNLHLQINVLLSAGVPTVSNVTQSLAWHYPDGAITLFLATFLGIPVSTTHTITGAIIGVGAARKVAAVRWNVASNVVFAWIVTLPATALFGSAFYELGTFLF
jgi:phosphate/sulfate permease